MPTPLQILMDPVSLTVLGLYGALILLEALFPARPLPRVRGWRTKALVVFVFYFFLSSYLPLLWGDTLAQYQLFNLEGLNPFVGAGIAVLVYELLVYVWHRTMHRVHWLWRSFHQMHHSAERLDSYGAFYFSPLDIVGFTFLTSLTLMVAVGLSAQAVTYFALRHDVPGRDPAHEHPHAAMAGLPRAEARELTASITVAAFITTTIPTCRCSTSCSAPSATRRNSSPKAVSTTALPRRSRRFSCSRISREPTSTLR